MTSLRYEILISWSVKGLYHACLASLYFVNYFNYSFLFAIEFEEFLANYKITALSPNR